MKVTKLSQNRIRIETRTALLYAPSNQAFKVVECPCSYLALIEELKTKPETVAGLLSLT